MPVLSFSNVSFYYQPDNFILRDVNFEIMEGEFVGIIGPNGGGKTTLLQLIMGFYKPSSGIIRLFGQTPLQARTKIGYVPQVLRFDRQFPISVLELVLMGRLSTLPWHGKYTSEDLQAAEKVLADVGLLEFKERTVGTLSGGQLQRALIARAVVGKPKLLLLDEPTASADVNAEADIYAILKRLQGQMTILMVTHHLQAAIHHVQRVLCVQNSVMMLKPEEVCQHFAIGLYHQPLIKL